MSELKRELNLTEATTLNMIDMVGIGPFIVVPLVIQELHGPYSLYAWLLGALLAFVDGMVWAELGAAMPYAGGSYVFLKEIFGKDRWGKYFSFLFIWQTTFQAPLVVASGAIGFAQYFTYLIPLSYWQQKTVSGSLVIFLIFLLYRRIKTIGKISVILGVGVIGTILWIIVSGFLNFNTSYFTDVSGIDISFSSLFFIALGNASIKTVYTYLGYYNVCHLGGEIQSPGINIPRSIRISIFGITALYLMMQTSILGVVPWQEAMKSQFIVSLFFEKIYGETAAIAATALILWIAFASLFAVLLGYSRIPYAAAIDGNFFKPFGKLHPAKNFPHISLLVLGSIAFIFSLLFRLKEVISAILAMRILVQFISQTLGIIKLRKEKPKEFFPYKMPLFPLPAILAAIIWLGLFYSTGYFAFAGIGMMFLGTLVFLVKNKRSGDWPFNK